MKMTAVICLIVSRNALAGMSMIPIHVALSHRSAISIKRRNALPGMNMIPITTRATAPTPRFERLNALPGRDTPTYDPNPARGSAGGTSVSIVMPFRA